MKISFVVPAFNEAGYIEPCLGSIEAAIADCHEQGHTFRSEIIVVDNNSTDTTAELARRAGATVVHEPENQISRARNTGARAATGDWLVFVDADSQVSSGLLADTLKLMESGRYLGCGTVMALDDEFEVPASVRGMLWLWTGISRGLQWAAGSYLVCHREAFDALGGFSEELYAAEEIDLSRRLKTLARERRQVFTVLDQHPLITSGRKARLYSAQELLAQFGRLTFAPRKTLTTREDLDVWYDGRR